MIQIWHDLQLITINNCQVRLAIWLIISFISWNCVMSLTNFHRCLFVYITHFLVQFQYSLWYTIFDTCFASYTFTRLLMKGTSDRHIDNFPICFYRSTEKKCKLKIICFNVKCLWLHWSISNQTTMFFKYLITFEKCFIFFLWSSSDQIFELLNSCTWEKWKKLDERFTFIY